jgi:hypothetical protein
MIVGVFALVAGGLLTAAAVLVSLGISHRSQLLHGTPTGGPQMSFFRRNRLLAGLGCFAAAGIVAIVGYLKISIEPELNRQIPYLASAGMLLVILVVLGGSLLVGEQLRTDAERIDELEAAITRLTAEVEPLIERPARRKRASTSKAT